MYIRSIVVLFFCACINTLSCVQYNYPADISFCIADLKFDGQNIKICEFGQGSRSKFKGYDALYGNGKVWTNLCKYLMTLQKSFWIVTPENYNLTKKYCSFNLRDIQKCGGQLISSLATLEQVLPSKKHAPSDNSCRDTSALSSYDEIVITNHVSFGKGFSAEFSSKHPNILVADQATASFVNSKYETTKLFNHPELQKYRPKNIVCNCVYNKQLAKSITKKLDCDKYVIKPLNASRGRGVIIVDRLHLNRELKKILADKDTLDASDPTYQYWINAKDKKFLVEEFVPSKTIFVDNKPYDATMRVIFVLSHDMGNINIEYLGAYWKLPARSLDEYAGLTNMHKSNINKDRKSSAIVDAQDFEVVKKEMTQSMSKAYAMMIEIRAQYLYSSVPI